MKIQIMNALKVSEAFCYICRSVLIEPVTVPCLHVFCYTCFESSMPETSYSCPLCRRRISNWVRTAKKSDKLVNRELWKKIKEQFKKEVHCKLRGEDDGLDDYIKEECPKPTIVSKPGEVAEEYSKFLDDYNKEQERMRKEEEEASRELISRLTEEEYQELEVFKKDRDVHTEKDEEIARKLQEEMNKEVVPSSSHHCDKQSSNKNKKVTKGPMDNFLKGIVQKNGFKSLLLEAGNDKRSASSASTDSIQSEMHHFKPIKVAPRTPPKQRPDGKLLEIRLTKVTPLKTSIPGSVFDASVSGKLTFAGKKINSPYSAFKGKPIPPQDADTYESPRKRLRFSSDEPESGVLKEITLGENSDSNSMSTSDVDLKPHEDAVKKSKQPTKKTSQNNFIVPSKMLTFDKVEDNPAEEIENDQFDTQDYLEPEEDIEEKLVQEQKRIEQLILQEKADRELALKLSREWDRRYELRKKPKPASTTRSSNKSNNKLQQTLLDTVVTKQKK